MNKKGLLISFEGIDKCGKSTQVELLRKNLSSMGKNVQVFREPGSTSISEQIRDILLSNDNKEMDILCETLLYSSARAQLVNEKIIPCLKENYIVLLDRYYHSTTAYQGYGRGIKLEFINSVNNVVSQGCTPEITFILDISPEEASKRRSESGRDRLEMSSIQFYREVRRGYLEMAAEDARLNVIDGTIQIKEIETIILNKVKECL